MKKTTNFLFLALAALLLGGAACQSGTKVEVDSEINAVTSQPADDSGVEVNAEVKGETENVFNVAPSSDQNVNANVNANVNVNIDAGTGSDTPVSSEPATKTFNLTLTKFSFSPDNMVVNVGDKVVVNATSVDTTHGFSIADLGVNLVIPQGETKSTTFIASKAGTYTFRCSVYCGSGHTQMTGTLIVK